MIYRMLMLLVSLLFFTGNGAGEGGGDAGGGSGDDGGQGAGAGAGAGAGGGSGSSGKPAGDGKSSSDEGGISIPKARFDEVNSELQRMKKAEEARQKKELADKGEHEQLAATEKSAREKAERVLRRTAIEAAFVKAAAGKVADIDAAMKLSDLSTIDVEISGDDEDATAVVKGDVAKVVEATLKAYPFLKPGASTTGGGMGGPVGGAGGNPPDMSKLTSDQKIALGLEQEIGKLPPQRQGVFGRQE